MKDYAARDVIYLPIIYFIFKENCQTGKYKNLTFENIADQCERYLKYTNLNLNIKNYNKLNLQKDKIVEGLIK
jgi:hypothetical protein